MQAPMLAIGADGTGCDTAAMFGMQVRMTARPGRGDRLADLLLQAADALADEIAVRSTSSAGSPASRM
jgi:hypothetical protein